MYIRGKVLLESIYSARAIYFNKSKTDVPPQNLRAKKMLRLLIWFVLSPTIVGVYQLAIILLLYKDKGDWFRCDDDNISLITYT